MDASIRSSANLLTGSLLIAACGLLFVFSFTYQGGLGFKTTEYSVVFPDVSGLTAGNPVKVEGHSCGYVKTLALDGGRARLTLAIDSRVRLHRGATATLRNKTFLGGRFIAVTAGDGNAPTLGAGDVLASAPEPLNANDISRFAESAWPKDSKLPTELLQGANTLHALWPEAERLLQLGRESQATLERMGRLKARVARLQAMTFDPDADALGRVSERLAAIGARIDTMARALDELQTALAAREPLALSELTDAVERLAALLDAAESAQASGLLELERILDTLLGFDELFVRRLLQQQGVRKLSPGAARERIETLQQAERENAF